MKEKRIMTSGSLIYLAIAPLVIIFHRVFESLLSATVVTPILSKVDSSVQNDIAVLTISLLFIGYTVPKFRTRYLVNTNLFLSLVAICVAYSWYRFNEQVWIFVPTSVSNHIRYLDFIYLPLAVYGLLLIKFRPGVGLSVTAHARFIEDNPLTDAKKDILSYDKYCYQIADKINNSVFGKSFAIGINGEWGTGKTSFMYLVEAHLTKKNQTIIHFNPWSSRSANGITLDFFNALSKTMAVYHSNLSSKLNDYANSLIESSGNTIINSFSVFKPNDSLATQYESINNTLKKIGRQTIIVIDDLDRLDEIETQEVIKLIRNTANFFNVVFLVAYDRNYLIQSIKRINEHNAEFFLEKIFQLEITLPHFEHRMIKRTLVDTLVKHLGADLREEIEEIVNDKFFHKNSFLLDFVLTIRDANRLANSLILNYPPVKNEVVFSEFFLLEQLKIKFPSVYELLYRQQEDFLEAKEEGIKKYAYRLKIEQPSQTFEIEKYLNDHADRLSFDPRYIPKMMLLLKSLFPVNQVFNTRSTRHLSIRYPSNFYKYFAFRLLDNNLSEVEFTNARKLPQEQFNTFLTEKVKAGHGWNLRDRFEEIKAFDDKLDFEKIIRAIFHLANQPRGLNFGFKEYIEYSGEDLYDKLYNKDNVLAKRFYDGDADALRQFILSLFQNAEFPCFVEGSIIKELTNRTFLEGFPISVEDLEQISVGYLSNYLSRQSSFTYEVWWHYNNCHFTRHPSYTSEVYIIPAAKTLVIDFIRKDVKGFFDTIIEYDMRNNEYRSIYVGVEALFGGWDPFGMFLETLDPTDWIIEFKRFFLAFKEKGFSKKIKFDFEYFENKKG